MRNKLAQTQHFFLNFKHFIMKAYLSTAILFQVLTLLLKQAGCRQEIGTASLSKSGLQKKNEVYPGDFYATTHEMDIKTKQIIEA